MHVTVSDEAVRSLNIQQKKKFRINTTFLEVLKSRADGEITGEIPTLNEYVRTNDDYKA